MISFLAILFTFSLVIFVHELGHFIVAVKSGVTVKKFSLGFGPELIGFTRKGVRYRISAIPMGGYVEMKGQSIEEEDALEEGSFMSLPPLKRIPILFAGAGMNFLMGIIIFFFIFLSAGVYIQTNIAQVGGLMEGFPAQAAGFEEGDRILSIGGVEVSTWDDLSQEISIRGGIETEFILEREGESFSIISVPKLDTELDRGFMGIIAPGEYVGMGVFRSLKQSFKFTFELCRSFIVFIGRMIVGTAPPEVSGPIGIAGAVSEAASAGLASLFQLIALISVQLGLINLFPIPILDGGHIILSILEKLKGSRLDDKKVMAANVVGLMLLFSLVLFASWQDIQRLFQ